VGKSDQDIDEDDDDLLSFARDVMYVYKHMTKMSCDLPNPTPAQMGLFEWVQNPEYKEKFYQGMLPKAQEALIKAKKTEDPESAIYEERQQIAILKVQLSEALEEAAGITA
jgi:hypothetical protein